MKLNEVHERGELEQNHGNKTFKVKGQGQGQG